jgi:hypothetical protein
MCEEEEKNGNACKKETIQLPLALWERREEPRKMNANMIERRKNSHLTSIE